MKLFLFFFIIALVNSVQSFSGVSFPAIGGSAVINGGEIHYTGGFDGFSSSNLHLIFDENSIRNDSTTMFQPRSFHTTTLYRDYLYIFGGVAGLEIKSLETDEHVVFESDCAPSPRIGHTASLIGSFLYIFGGVDSTGKYLNDMWRINLDENFVLEWELVQANSPVPARAFHSAIVVDVMLDFVFLNQQDHIYFFGGESGNKFFNDVWKFDSDALWWDRCFMSTVSPKARAGHMSTIYEDSMIIFGGYDSTGLFDDMWAFDLFDHTWEGVPRSPNSAIPSARAFFGSVSGEGTIITIGGLTSTKHIDSSYWNPYLKQRFVDTSYPEEWTSEIWQWSWATYSWSLIDCATEDEACQSRYTPSCSENCNGNGICIDDDVCVCAGQWSGYNCSINTCNKYRGFKVNFIDRFLISESLLKLGKHLAQLKEDLVYIKGHLPSFDDLLSCAKLHPELTEMVLSAASTHGVKFLNEIAVKAQVFTEFNQALDLPQTPYFDLDT